MSSRRWLDQTALTNRDVCAYVAFMGAAGVVAWALGWHGIASEVVGIAALAVATFSIGFVGGRRWERRAARRRERMSA